MKVVVGMAVVVGIAIAAPVAGQTHPPQDRMTTALDRAREVGIPVALLESKIAEGKAKGVSMERIAAAVERREAALEKAREALRGQPDADDSLSVAADAVETGVSDAVLKAVAQSAPRDRRNVAIAALTELVHQGHGSQQALDRVRDALKRGPDALANLPADAASRRGPGASGRDGDTRGGESGTPSAVPPPGRGPSSGNGGPGSGGASGTSSGPGNGRSGR